MDTDPDEHIDSDEWVVPQRSRFSVVGFFKFGLAQFPIGYNKGNNGGMDPVRWLPTWVPEEEDALALTAALAKVRYCTFDRGIDPTSSATADGPRN